MPAKGPLCGPFSFQVHSSRGLEDFADKVLQGNAGLSL